jgi:hypothetical protein
MPVSQLAKSTALGRWWCSDQGRLRAIAVADGRDLATPPFRRRAEEVEVSGQAAAVVPTTGVILFGGMGCAYRCDPVQPDEVRSVPITYHGVVCLATTPDGALVAQGEAYHSNLTLWSPAISSRSLLTGHCAPVAAVLLSATGRRLFSFGHDELLMDWDLDRGVATAFSLRPTPRGRRPRWLVQPGVGVRAEAPPWR